jgi:hypothetical protein
MMPTIAKVTAQQNEMTVQFIFQPPRRVQLSTVDVSPPLPTNIRLHGITKQAGGRKFVLKIAARRQRRG